MIEQSAEQAIPAASPDDRRVGNWTIDKLDVHLYDDSEAAGRAGGEAVATLLKALLRAQPTVRVLFPAAPSQVAMLRTLREAADIEWSRVVAFHLDEYIGLPPHAPERFATFLREHLFDHVTPGEVHLMRPDDNDPQPEARRYATLLSKAPLDLACLGIGDNGHLAFNDPPVADFDDPDLVKVVDLDTECRVQQVNDGCFRTLADVPRRALTVTIAALMSTKYVVTVAPGHAKAAAVRDTLTGPVSERCPASVLRTHPRAQLFVSSASAALLPQRER